MHKKETFRIEMFKTRYIIVSDCVELGGVVVRLRSFRHVAQEVIADPCSRRAQFSLTTKQAVFVVDRVRLFSEYVRFPLAVSSHECSIYRMSREECARLRENVL